MQKSNFDPYLDLRGTLLPIEFNHIPFTPKRLFIVKDVPKGIERGGHAHHKTHQYLICLSGKIIVILDDGSKKQYIDLKPYEGLHIPPYVWDSQIFLTGMECLLVLANTSYKKSDYINDYDYFLKKVNPR